MSIVEARDENGQVLKGKNGNIIYRYQKPAWRVLYNSLADLLDVFERYLNVQQDVKIEDFNIDKVLLSEILVRIDKRKDYFIIYHDITYINEIKEAGLVSYWITKMKPFQVKDTDENLYKKYKHVNEAFAVFILYSVIKEESSRKEPDVEFKISKKYNRKIMYALKYWDLSKEAFMLVGESLCESMG